MNSQILAIEKFIPKGLCSLYIVLKNELPTSQNIFATFSQFTFSPISYHVKFQLTPIYVCSNIKYWTMFYISVNSFLFFWKKDTKLCSYCRLQDETINHVFVECKFAIKLWSDLRHYCQRSFVIPILNPQSATFGFFEIDPDLVIPFNHILQLYEYYIYWSRDSSKLSFAALLKSVKKVFILGKKIRQEMKEKLKLSLKNGIRWCK